MGKNLIDNDNSKFESFKKDFKKINEGSFSQCYQCGTCGIVCPLSSENKPFPRKEMVLTQWGMTDQIEHSLDPWLCYYCGQCSEKCPRQAKPGELMMSLRRWLITRYDWTGLARLFYTSSIAEFFALILVAFFVLVDWSVLFGLNPAISSKTTLNQILPPEKIHLFFDLPVAIILSLLLISFIVNMYYKTVLSDKTVKIPISLYFTTIGILVWHFITQWKFSDCAKDTKSFLKDLSSGKYNYWIIHFILMTSYTSLFVGILFFLSWFQTDNQFKLLHTVLYDYYASIGLIIGTIYFAFQRIKKSSERSKTSQHTDWAFIVLLFFTAITGVLIRLFIVYNYSLQLIFYIYLIHLLIAIPMLVVEVPFSKWSHLAYRPLAIYFNELKNKSVS